MIKKIIVLAFLPLVAAERDAVSGLCMNPGFAGAAAQQSQAWESDEEGKEDIRSVRSPVVIPAVIQDMRRLLTLTHAESRHRGNPNTYLNPLDLYVGEGAPAHMIQFAGVCDNAAFLRSIQPLLGGFSLSHFNPTALPVLTEPVTFVCGSRTMATPVTDTVSFRPIQSNGYNGGFLSVLNALAVQAFFKGDTEKAQKVIQFSKGVVSAQGVLSHKKFADGDAGRERQEDSKIAYPTDMTSEHVAAMIEMVSRASRIGLVLSDRLPHEIRAMVGQLQSGGDVSVATRVVTERLPGDRVEFYTLALALYREKRQMVGAIIDPNNPHSNDRIEGARTIVSRVADKLGLK